MTEEYLQSILDKMGEVLYEGVHREELRIAIALALCVNVCLDHEINRGDFLELAEKFWDTHVSAPKRKIK